MQSSTYVTITVVIIRLTTRRDNKGYYMSHSPCGVAPLIDILLFFSSLSSVNMTEQHVKSLGSMIHGVNELDVG